MDKDWSYQDHPYEREYERELRRFAAESELKREGVRSRVDERKIEALEMKYRQEQQRERDSTRREKLRHGSRSRKESPEREARRVRIVDSLSPEPGLIISPESSPYLSEKAYRSRSHSREREDAFWKRSRSHSEDKSPIRRRRSKSRSRERLKSREKRRLSRSPDRKQSRSRDRGELRTIAF